MTNKRRTAELGVMVVMVVVSMWVGRALGAAVFTPERGPYVPPPAAAPDSIPALTPEGEAVTIPLGSRLRPVVVFALSVDCSFCKMNLPHWRDIAARIEAVPAAEIDLVILSTSPAEQTAAYLQENGLAAEFAVVSDDDIASLDLPGVPATIAITPGGVAMRRWVGVFNASERDALFDWLRENTEKSGDF